MRFESCLFNHNKNNLIIKICRSSSEKFQFEHHGSPSHITKIGFDRRISTDRRQRSWIFFRIRCFGRHRTHQPVMTTFSNSTITTILTHDYHSWQLCLFVCLPYRVIFLEDDDVAAVKEGSLSIHRLKRSLDDSHAREITTLKMEIQQIMKGWNNDGCGRGFKVAINGRGTC